MVTLAADSRLLLHLGRASVLENVGLYADRATGLPMIPGTALKGIVSTWACWEVNQNLNGSFREAHSFNTLRREFPCELALQILGDDSPGCSNRAGDVIFVGGFPCSPPALGLDIVNPHCEADGSMKTRLTPNPFLCIEPGAESIPEPSGRQPDPQMGDSAPSPGTLWRFAFCVRFGAANATELIATTARWIEEALTQLGLGAKTASGYGRFRRPTSADLTAETARGEKGRTAAAAAAAEAKAAAEKAALRAASQSALQTDYPNEPTFKRVVLDALNPAELHRLETEVPKLQKPQNEALRRRLVSVLAAKAYKDVRKRLREKSWFPKDWLPPQ